MNKILERFARPRVLLPVIHCIDAAQTGRAVDVAFQYGADGVFLINQGGLSPSRVVQIAGVLAQVSPFVGINVLGNTPLALVACHRHKLHGLLSDRCDVPSDMRTSLGGALFFGGVAFKYQPRVADVGAAAAVAAGAGVDVITTSGDGTGRPPTVEKVRTMRQTLGDHALAIASGITAENVAAFLPLVDAFLVATGIEERFGVFDPGRVRALADAIHGWDDRPGAAFRRHYGLMNDCRAGSDGDCNWNDCPQLRDGEPAKTGRHCPLDRRVER